MSGQGGCVDGGLKLWLAGAGSNDRRVRCAPVTVSRIGAGSDLHLVTDAQGRMRYRLPGGDYLLRAPAAQAARFSVRDGRWTTVRVRLP